MKKILIIGKYTLKENISNKIFNGVLYFGILLMIFITILSEIALYEEVVVIKDTGLFLIEFLIMIITVYISSTYILKAIEEKSIYLVLTKAVTKSKYVLGVNLGIIYLIFCNLFIIGGILGFILYFKGALDLWYLKSLLFVGLKLSILSSLGILFSVISESFVLSTIFTLFTYILGHGIMEIKEIALNFQGTLIYWLLEFIYLILPKFNLLNYRDYLKGEVLNFPLIIIYIVFYIGFTLTITNIIFNRKRL